MKKLILAAALAASTPTQAAADFSLSFDIVGGLQLLNGSYVSLDLDGIVGNQFISVFGALESNSGLYSPATGSCFVTGAGGAFCNLQVDHLSITVDLSATLSGTISVKSANGVTLDTSPLVLIN